MTYFVSIYVPASNICYFKLWANSIKTFINFIRRVDWSRRIVAYRFSYSTEKRARFQNFRPNQQFPKCADTFPKFVESNGKNWLTNQTPNGETIPATVPREKKCGCDGCAFQIRMCRACVRPTVRRDVRGGWRRDAKLKRVAGRPPSSVDICPGTANLRRLMLSNLFYSICCFCRFLFVKFTCGL